MLYKSAIKKISMPAKHFFFRTTNISKRYGYLLVFTIYSTCFLSLTTKSQTAGTEVSLSISGEVKMPLTLTLAALDTMKKVSLTVTNRNDTKHIYTGVDLFSILKKAGVTLGEELKGRNLTKYILTEASDGYQVVFSLAEADPSFSQKKIILATRKDNALLPINEGPFHIIMEGELRQSRFIKQVISIKIKSGG